MSRIMCRRLRSLYFPALLQARPRSSSLRSTQNDAQWLVYRSPEQGQETATSAYLSPYELMRDELKQVHSLIRQELSLNTQIAELRQASQYYFDGHGKSFRPMLTLLMARALNFHNYGRDMPLLHSQRQMAIISEMVHTASLVHDDVIDDSDLRRGKPSLRAVWNEKKGAVVGDFILTVSTALIARIGNDDVTVITSQLISDLVRGEFMQLRQSGTTENEMFSNYLNKTYCKTASLIANFLKAVAILADCEDQVTSLAFEYGRNVGLAFQLIDDVLDFEASSEQLGKPAAADLKLGLATAPVLFACENFPELREMVLRRFAAPGDPERALQLVCQSRGLEQTRLLAQQHCEEARRLAGELATSRYQRALLEVPAMVLSRRN